MNDAIRKGFKFLVSVVLSPRMKSLAWLCGAQLAAQMLQIVIERASELELSSGLVVVLGLVLGQLTKAINNHIQGKPTGLRA